MRWLTFIGDDSNVDRFLETHKPSSVSSSLCEWIYIQCKHVASIPDFTGNPLAMYERVLRTTGTVTRNDVARIGMECNVRYGKWMIHANRENVDDIWKLIGRECYDGNLGPCCKVVPAAEVGNRECVICVYTSDFLDVRDVFRVRVRLDEYGFTERLPYKPEVHTKLGIYRDSGPLSPSLYYE